MPKTPEELEKMFHDLQDAQSKTEKAFKLQLESAEKTAKEYKELAEKSQEQLRTFQLESEKREKELKEAQARAHETSIQEFVEQHVKAGRIIPALKEKLITFMKSLTSDSAVMTFTEKDGSTRSHNQVSLFKEILGAIKPVVPMNELSVSGPFAVEAPEAGDQPVEHFAEVITNGERKKLPVSDMDIATKAFEYQDKMAKAGQPVTYEAALIAVSPRKSQIKA